MYTVTFYTQMVPTAHVYMGSQLLFCIVLLLNVPLLYVFEQTVLCTS